MIYLSIWAIIAALAFGNFRRNDRAPLWQAIPFALGWPIVWALACVSDLLLIIGIY